jgi:hypothetical protein
MDRIELALRRFRHILPEPLTAPMTWPLIRNAELWLGDDVLAALAEVCPRPDFRDHAAAALRDLDPGSPSPRRRAVDDVDDALVAAARALDALAHDPPVADALDALFPPREQLVETAAVIRAGAPATFKLTPEVVDRLNPARERVRLIATRPWSDLVCPPDYFEPYGGLMLPGEPPAGCAAGPFSLRETAS